MKNAPLIVGCIIGAVLAVGALFFIRSNLVVFSVSTPAPVAATSPAPPAPAPAKTKLQVFFVKGFVKELKPDGRTIVVDHEEIPNYMEKMTMPFKVRTTNELAGLGTNDQIHFRLNVAEFESWIDQVTKTGKAATPAADPTRKDFRLVREVEVLKVGDALPDYPLTNHLGQPFRTSQFKGQALALTFIFTLCPMPDFCPRMSLRFAEATKLLKQLPNAPTNYHLLSVSFDVQRDTPAVLQNYANMVKAQHGADLGRWTFATGALIEIDDLTERFGLTFARDKDSFMFNHNLRTVVIDATGKVQKIFIGNDWKADALVEELIRAAQMK